MKTVFTRLTFLLAAFALVACGSSEEPAASPESEGGEDTSVIEDTKAAIDETHEDFKEAVKPAAEFVDEKTNAVVDEGKSAVGAGEDDEGSAGEAEPAPE